MKDDRNTRKAPRLDGFRLRAIREAQRYGGDPWIFVRELLQNARDAGATQVQFLYKESDKHCELHCLDNGEGMAWEHAQRFLFSLYTSSKEGAKNKAGRFGVGFWSILRFAPAGIVIRSRPRGARLASGWGIALDGMLRKAKCITPAQKSGTEIILTKQRSQNGEAVKLLDAVRDHGRFLTQRDDPSRSLEILVNGVRINEPFALPEPSLYFSGKGVRGVVALAPRAKVELFSRGLRVRCAATLDDLVSSQPQTSSLPDGLNVAPQILLDCDNIQVLLHRSDVRENAELTKALSLTRRNLRRLVEAQLSGMCPASLMEIALRTKQWLFERSTVFYIMSSSALAATVVTCAWNLNEHRDLAGPPLGTHLALGSMRRNYQGPTVHEIDVRRYDKIDFTYTPTDLKLHFRQFSISNLQTIRPQPRPKFSRYRGAQCAEKKDCVTIEMRLDQSEGLRLKQSRAINLPEATGYRIDPASIHLLRDKKNIPLRSKLVQDQQGDPWLTSSKTLAGRLRYKLRKSRAPNDQQASRAIKDPTFQRWKRRQGSMNWRQAQTRVAHDIRYAIDQTTARAHQRAMHMKQSVFARGLGIGAGDCDVQNTVLAALLRAQGYQARLALGHVGQGGQLRPIAHAWTEFRRSPNAAWRVADASILKPPKGAGLLAQGPESSAQALQENSEPNSDDQGISNSRIGWWWIGSGLALMAFGIAVFRLQKAPAGSFDKSHQRLTQLLLSALERPSSFSGIPGVFRRPVVSRLGKGPVSLKALKSSHRYGRLWTAGHPHAIAQRAIASGDDVLDDHCPIANAIARHLQCEDLDRWQMIWDSRLVSNSHLIQINASFEYLLLSLHLVVCTELGPDAQSLHLGPHPLTPGITKRSKLQVPARCLVFYPPQHPLITALDHEMSAWARFSLVQDALSRIAMDEELRARALGYFAADDAQEYAA